MHSQHHASNVARPLVPPTLALPPTRALPLALALLAACGGSAPPSEPAQDNVGEVIPDPEGVDTTGFLIDPHFGGQASSIAIQSITWGRLVDVYEVQPSGERVLRHGDFLIGDQILAGNGYQLEEHALTQRTHLLVHHPIGSEEYSAVLEELEQGLKLVQEGTMVPRNAALSLRFSDLLDSASIRADTVRLMVGEPNGQPFTARILADPNHGGTVALVAGEEERFYTTRVLIDPTVSEVDLLDGSAGGVSGANGEGFPEGTTHDRSNMAIRIPSRADPIGGLFDVLRNLVGNGLNPEASGGQIDQADVTLPDVRRFRAGGRTELTGDPNNGFLTDLRPPQVIGSQRVRVNAVRATGETGTFRVDYRFENGDCALAPRVGDLLEAGSQVAEFLGAESLDGQDVRGALVRSFGATDLTEVEGLQALVVTPFDGLDGQIPACFVTVTPPAAEFPLRRVDPNVSVVVRFSEPMDSISLNGLEGLVMTRTPGEPTPTDIVVADVQQAPDLRTYTWRPRLPLSHLAGEAEQYTLRMDLSDEPPGDLAGNPLSVPLPQIQLELNPDAPTDLNGGWVLRFNSLDEDGNGFAELRGQFLKQEGRIIPRPVSRFSVRADRHSSIVEVMQTLPHSIFASPHDNGVFEPLTHLGSRTMSLWRYADLGMALQDESLFNVDVEGISWIPKRGSVVADNYDEFSMSLSHGSRLPDEGADLVNSAIWAPDSGLVTSSFDDNSLSDPENEPMVVHDRHDGYFIDPVELFVSEGGDTMMPFPMNRSGDAGDHRTYTWRDTAIVATGGAESLGLPIGGQVNSTEVAEEEVGTVAPAGFVPSIGLPLLMDWRTWPNSSGGHNEFDVRLGGFPTSFGFDLPANFRIHSTGGVSLDGDVELVNPSTASAPKGGFHTVPAIATPGTPSPAADSLFYTGQLDLVVRVSRAHTLWFDTGGSATLLEPVTVPLPDSQPVGTEIEFDFRAAEAVFGEPAWDAHALDAYGDRPVVGTAGGTYGDPSFKNIGVTFLDEEARVWSEDRDRVRGGRWLQARLSFLNNIATGDSPELRAVGFAYDIDG